MKLIVSVMPRSIEEAQAIDVLRYQDADIIEWRADFLPKEAILQVAPHINSLSLFYTDRKSVV